MSFSPVFGRSSAVASGWMRLRYFLSIEKVTSARPSRSCTLLTSPTRIPETRIICPWPGTTACAVVNSAFSVHAFSSRIGSRRFWWSRT